MKEIIPQKLIELAQKLNKELYVVGGTCRDYIAGLSSDYDDWDICAAAGADEVCAAAESAGFEVKAVYKRTGTLQLRAGGHDYEYTCFRTDRYVRGAHSPEEVYFTDDISLDARRRDFKCNAVYYAVKEGKFVDPLGGIEDCKRKVLSTVAPAEKVFGEDGLRLMRLCRIAAQTGFTPTEQCVGGATVNAQLIDDIAAERVRKELELILDADGKYGVTGGQYAGLKLLHRIKVLERILPELTAGDKMEQRGDFHSYDVLEHSLRCVLYAPQRIRLAALLHDVGKPYCKNTTGKFTFHEVEGARIAGEICARLRVSKRETERVCQLVRLHMYDLTLQAGENKVRKFIVAHQDVLDDLLLLKQADFSACKDDLTPAPCVAKWKGIIAKMQSEGVPFTIKQLYVRGDELIAAGVEKSDAGKALLYLLGECAVDARLNVKEKLIKSALSHFSANL